MCHVLSLLGLPRIVPGVLKAGILGPFHKKGKGTSEVLAAHPGKGGVELGTSVFLCPDTMWPPPNSKEIE